MSKPMSPRALRRAAEHAARKASAKQAKLQQQTEQAQAATAGASAAAPTIPNVTFEEKPSRTISDAQLAANRANAQKSTGPSPEGIPNSCRNNFRHGLTQDEGTIILLETESEADYNKSFAAFQKEWNPKTATELDLVERLTNHQWLRRRSQRLAAEFQDARGLITDEKKYALYRRYEVQHERAFNKALADLMRLRSLQIRERNGFESQRRQEEQHVLKIQALKHRALREKLELYAADFKFNTARADLAQAGLYDQAKDDQIMEELQAQAAR